MNVTRLSHAGDILLIGILFANVKQRDQYVSTSNTFADPTTITETGFLLLPDQHKITEDCMSLQDFTQFLTSLSMAPL